MAVAGVAQYMAEQADIKQGVGGGGVVDGKQMPGYLDMMEELRSPLADRFVQTLFHRKQLSQIHFERDEEAAFLNEKGRRVVLSAWQKRKGEIITHPFLGEKIPIGIIPYAQAMLLARVLRGDLDRYPPFTWR